MFAGPRSPALLDHRREAQASVEAWHPRNPWNIHERGRRLAMPVTKTTKRQLRIAVIGAGHWGPNLIRNFHNHQASVVAWVVDRDESRLALTRGRHPDIQLGADP